MVSGEQFALCIPAAMYAEMVAHVVEGYPNETCGALGSKDGHAVKHYPTANAAQEPDDFSEISPEDLFQIFNDIDEYDGKMVYYHSHPLTEAYPSPRDIEWAIHNQCLYVIFSHRHYPEPPYARAFLIDGDGIVIEGKIEIV